MVASTGTGTGIVCDGLHIRMAAGEMGTTTTTLRTADTAAIAAMAASDRLGIPVNSRIVQHCIQILVSRDNGPSLGLAEHFALRSLPEPLTLFVCMFMVPT